MRKVREIIALNILDIICFYRRLCHPLIRNHILDFFYQIRNTFLLFSIASIIRLFAAAPVLLRNIFLSQLQNILRFLYLSLVHIHLRQRHIGPFLLRVNFNRFQIGGLRIFIIQFFQIFFSGRKIIVIGLPFLHAAGNKK